MKTQSHFEISWRQSKNTDWTPWTARGRSGHLFCVPHCREIACQNNVGNFYHQEETPQRYLDMKKFMEIRTRALEAATQQSASAIDKKPTSSPQLEKFHSNISTSVTTCECCDKNHKICQCQSFKALSNRAELSWARQKDFASTAYTLDIEVKYAMDQLVRSAQQSFALGSQ